MNQHLPSARRGLYHLCTAGLLATATFLVTGFLPATLANRLVLAVLSVLMYVVLRAFNLQLRQISELKLLVAQLGDENFKNFRQIESLMSIFAVVKPEATLPPTRVWAMSPDLLCEIATITLTKRPELVLEASSGTSTLIIAYCLKKLGTGRLVSLEHNSEYAERTRELLAAHRLDSIAQVIHCPLVPHKIGGRELLWYDISPLSSMNSINLLVIDGPPAKDDNDSESRYPALPLLFDRLASDCQIILDDAAREGERAITAAWMRHYPSLRHRYLDFEKGASIFVKPAV